VELAVCLPLILLLVFGSIEAANAIHLKHTATIAAYEAVQTITAPGGSQTEAIARATAILNQRDIVGSTILVNPPVSAATLSGTPIAITITIPVSSNSLTMTGYFNDWIVSSTANMERL
jgi:Flp pilus assembly protein TadG